MCAACLSYMRKFQAAIAADSDFLRDLCGFFFATFAVKVWSLRCSKIFTAKFAKKTGEISLEVVNHSAAHEEVVLAAFASIQVQLRYTGVEVADFPAHTEAAE
jgi:hypothetical protein